MITCARHNRYEADYHCSRCQAGFCRACAVPKQMGNAKFIVCPNCGDRLTDLELYRPAVPFWYRVPQIFFYPLQGDGWVRMLGWAAFSAVVLGLASIGSIFGLAFWLLYTSLLISYFYRIIARSEDGKFDIPDWTEFTSFYDLIWPVIQFWIAGLMVFWPLAAFMLISILAKQSVIEGIGLMFTPGGLVLMAILIPLGVFYLPMSLLAMGVFKSVKMVANPVFLTRQIIKIWKEYLLAFLMMASLLFTYGIISGLMSMFLYTLGIVRYLVVFPVNGVMQLYLYMVIGHLLGYLAYQTRFKLKWWPETQEEPTFTVAGKPRTMEWNPELKVAGGGMAALAMAGAGAAVAVAQPVPSGGTMFGGPSPAGGTMYGGPATVAAPAATSRPAPPPPPSPPPRSARPTAPRPTASAAPAAAPIDPELQEMLTREINDGMSMIQHGRHEEAAEIFDRILADNPNHLGALRGRMVASSALKDIEGSSKYAQTMGAELARQEAFDPLWDVYQQQRNLDKNFLLRARDQIALSRWLVSENKPLDAARVLREIGVGRPDDPLAPKALYQCADLLWKSCGKPDVAKQMFEYVLKRYPQSAFGDQVRAALAAIAAGK